MITIGKIFTDNTYIQKNPDWHAGDSEWKAGKIEKLLGGKLTAIQTLAEVGCGAGGIVSSISKRYAHLSCSGYEVSRDAYDIAVKKESDNMKFYFRHIEEVEQQFDCLLCIDVFEHVEDYIGFLKNIRKKAEFKVFHIPLDISVTTVVRSDSFLQKRKNLGHLHYFTRETALDTLKYCGYEIVSEGYTQYFWDFPSKTIRAKLKRYPRKLMYLISPHLACRFLSGSSLLVLAR